MAENTKYFKIDVAKFYYSKLNSTKPPFRKKIKLWLTNFGLHCITVYRFGQFSLVMQKKNKIIGILFFSVYFIMKYMTELIHHVVIDNEAKIGPGFFLMHASNIYIGPVIIGENCTIHHNLTLGQRVAARDMGAPKIGNNVWIGPGAIIYGSIHIGDNSTISAGCVLSKNIPEKSLVSGNPGRVISNDYDNGKFLTFQIPKSNRFKKSCVQKKY